MARPEPAVGRGAILAFLVALTACGNAEPPAVGEGRTPLADDLRIPRTLSIVVQPSGPHYLFPNEGFGKTVALSGARLAIADYLDWQVYGMKFPHVDTFEIVDGVAAPIGKLPAEGYGELCFGEAIALLGDLLAIGEPCANGGTGEVHVYARSGGGWVEEPALAGAAGAARFGAAISGAANRLVVGAPAEPMISSDGAILPDAGAVYVYGRAGGAWRLEARLTPADVAGSDGFGSAVSMTAARIAATSPGRWNGDAAGNPIAPNGRAHLFELQADGTWIEAALLQVTHGGPGEWTGRTIATCAETVFVSGSAWEWPAVHLFRAGTAGWVEDDLVDPNPAANGYVDALACDGDLLGVGMPYASPDGSAWLGTARFFKRLGGAWLFMGEVAGGAAGDRAGHAVALDGPVVAVGAPGTLVNGRALGVVKVKRF